MRSDRDGKRSLSDPLLALLLAPLAGLLAWVVIALPKPPPSLAEEVYRRLEEAGVQSPVTAVLLNFRGYDTLLEIGVLLLAVIACLALRHAHPAGLPLPPSPADPVLAALIRLLIPVMVIVAGYLLWAGTHAPGGAFQAGAVLGAAGVLLQLGETIRFATVPDTLTRGATGGGFAIFLGVAAAGVLSGRNLLDYPTEWAGTLIVLLETVLTLSIGVTLAALFAANPLPSQSSRQEEEAPR